MTITSIPALVTSVNGNNTELIINCLPYTRFLYPVIHIVVISGTFKFAVGQSAADSEAEYVDGDEVVITLRIRSRNFSELNLHFMAAGVGETFKITF